jgi:hypothetical protein
VVQQRNKARRFLFWSPLPSVETEATPISNFIPQRIGISFPSIHASNHAVIFNEKRLVSTLKLGDFYNFFEKYFSGSGRKSKLPIDSIGGDPAEAESKQKR